MYSDWWLSSDGTMYTSTLFFFMRSRSCARRLDVSTVSISRLLRELVNENERTERLGECGGVRTFEGFRKMEKARMCGQRIDGGCIGGSEICMSLSMRRATSTNDWAAVWLQ